MAEQTERIVTVTVTTSDRISVYDSKRREFAERTFPVDTDPGIIAGWAGRTAIAQVRDAERSYPRPKPAEPERSPEERLAAVAAAPNDDAAAKAAGDGDLPF